LKCERQKGKTAFFPTDEKENDRMANPKCGRCGYEYDDNVPEKPVIQMIGKDGRLYTACYDCICDIGRAKSKKEKNEIIESFKK